MRTEAGWVSTAKVIYRTDRATRCGLRMVTPRGAAQETFDDKPFSVFGFHTVIRPPFFLQAISICSSLLFSYWKKRFSSFSNSCPFATGTHYPVIISSGSSLSYWKKGSNSIPVVCCFAAQKVDRPLSTDRDGSTLLQVVCPLTTGTNDPAVIPGGVSFSYWKKRSDAVPCSWSFCFSKSYLSCSYISSSLWLACSVGVVRPPAAISSRLPPRASAHALIGPQPTRYLVAEISCSCKIDTTHQQTETDVVCRRISRTSVGGRDGLYPLTVTYFVVLS